MDPQIKAQCQQTIEVRTSASTGSDGRSATWGSWVNQLCKMEKKSIRRWGPTGGITYSEVHTVKTELEIPTGSEVRINGVTVLKVEMSQPVYDEYGTLDYWMSEL